MKSKLRNYLIAGTISIGVLIGIVLYKLEDIKDELMYRDLCKNFDD